MKLLLASFSLLACTALVAFRPAQTGQAAHPFSSSTVDLGVVVSDLDASAKFYKEVLGFTELDGFSVGAEFCTDCGLTDGHPLTIRVFSPSKDDGATKIKLMELPDVESKRGDNNFIHSQLGLSYLTVYIKNTNAALEHLEKAGVKPLAKTPVLIGEDPSGPYLTLVRDPDGNLIELIGPRQ